MYQSHLSSGRPAGPLRPPAPAPVLTAVKLMCAGAAVVAVSLSSRSSRCPSSAAARPPLRRVWAAASRGPVVITVGTVGGLVVIALWLWMARANSQGRDWARILSTVLFGLATLQLIGGFSEPGSCSA